jgi:2'-5' RNA ligase
MRLFLALNFDESTKNALMKVVDHLKEVTLSGNYTLRDNLHVTLAFLGERSDEEVDIIKKAMANISCKPFTIVFSGVGSFTRGDIARLYWIGIESNPVLDALFLSVRKGLADAGIQFEEKEIVPHLTIGREIRLKDSNAAGNIPIKVTPIRFTPKKISLMESTRENGKPLYIEIAKKNLSTCD